jgi:hypothetical protein
MKDVAPQVVGKGSTSFFHHHLLLYPSPRPQQANFPTFLNRALVPCAELIDPSHLTHVIVSPRLRAQRTAELLFSGVSDKEKSKMDWETTEDIGEWKYGEYEGMHVSGLELVSGRFRKRTRRGS